MTRPLGFPLLPPALGLAFALAAAPSPEVPFAAPVIWGFSPSSGPAGTAVTVVGMGLAGATRVTFGGVAATFTAQSAWSLTAKVPAGAATGPLTVTTAGGTGKSSSAFTVPALPGPRLTAFTPAQGAAGTRVTLTGSGFTAGATVAFNGTPAAAVSFVSASRLTAIVPAGATTGSLTVTTAAGAASSATVFTVPGGNPPPAQGLRLGGWYINQGVQTLGRTVPLVAGRAGLLRVFVLASAAGTAPPTLRVTLTGGSPSPWVRTLPAAATVPTALAEGTLSSSWNLAIPAAVLAPGGTLKLEGLPGTPLQAALDVRQAPVFRITLIPISQQGRQGRVADSGRTLTSWLDRLHAMFPLGDLPAGMDIKVGAAYTTQADLNAGSGSGWNTLLGEIDRKRVAEGTGRAYYGVVNVDYDSGIAGMGFIGKPAAIGWDKSGYGEGGNYPDVFTHEVGHTFNRQHAPCGVSPADPSWPADAAHQGAQIGVYGFDVANRVSKGPAALKDVMSYCHPIWSSDYTYKGILDFRAAGRGVEVPREEALDDRVDCLLISGRIRDGQLQMDPAFTVRTRPELPLPGEFVLEAKDLHGETLLQIAFSATPVVDGPDWNERKYAFAIPLDCLLQPRLHHLRVLGPAGQLLSRFAGSGAVYQRPTLTALGPGRVRLQWDSKAFPTALVRDSASGEILALAAGGLLDLDASARVLEVTLSEGVLSHRFFLPAP